jgi:hypothetical protein
MDSACARQVVLDVKKMGAEGGARGSEPRTPQEREEDIKRGSSRVCLIWFDKLKTSGAERQCALIETGAH